MAPILAAAVGITPQIIDDSKLRQLRASLVGLKTEIRAQRDYSSSDEVPTPEDTDRLIELLKPVQRWVFEEQVDLQEWIVALNKIDACLSYYIEKYPSLLLISPVKRSKSRGAVKAPIQLFSKPAESLDDVNAVPEAVSKNVCTIVRFLASLLLNASNKSVFNSVEELVDLLGAADDSVAAAALEALSNLATPPSLHKQQAPDVQQHATALHTSRTTSHKRLISLARGWGTRGSGLGLYSCSTADDSDFGQGALPKEAGELNFAFFRRRDTAGNKEAGTINESYLVRLTLHVKEIVDDPRMTLESSRAIEESEDASKQKRRRVASIAPGERNIRSTAELFFTCLQKAGGRGQIPEDRLFPLLADIRLTRSFHCQETRAGAIERRLRALIAILHSHPSQEVMSGYFQAQPELCVELIDLIRPTVSSAAVSAASSDPIQPNSSMIKQDGISTLSNPSIVPYGIRKLAVDTLTALVARRDGSSGALTGVARHSNVLSELGVGKGQYLGLLPTLIRFSLATLGSLCTFDQAANQPKTTMDSSAEDSVALEVGLAFVETTSPPPLPRSSQLQRALEFIDSVLTLTAAVVSTPSGTSALTECGLIPALLTHVASNSQESISVITAGFTTSEATRIKALFRFVTAQAVQILEGAIVTHNNALSAFHDLRGVEVLTSRLSTEILRSQLERENGKLDADSSAMECDPPEVDTAAGMDIDSSLPGNTRIHSSHRVLLFSIVTCLTVVFHQESTSSSVVTPSGAAQLRQTELTAALVDILENIDAYGGHLASLIATLLSDVMNSDPHVVHHVHESGLAAKFLAMIHCEADAEPNLPAVPELIMAIPNVLSALALTEDGANALKEANPFPSLLRLFYHPRYSMPRSRCLLNEMTAIVGTGLDEIMRHVTSVRPLICDAITQAMKKVAAFGDDLTQREVASSNDIHDVSDGASDLENERSFLMQYVLNFGQILEQILHNEDHCEPFVAAGGLESLLRLYPYIMPNGTEFLSHVSSLSCPSISTLTHATSEDSLTLAFKCIALRYDSLKLIQTMIKYVQIHLTKLKQLQKEVRTAFPFEYEPESDSDATLILEGLPRKPVYAISQQDMISKSIVLANYLRHVVALQWVTSLLSAVIKAACQRSQETGTGWSRTEREWKKELSSHEFKMLFEELSYFHQSAIFEVCRIRTEAGYEDRDKTRLAECKERRLHFRLRIVCPEGAVVRDGIEIDSCASVGCMEMGEITNAFDRCVNSSGVLRYRTHRGWVSEQTRGHGREPIAEVLNVWEPTDESIIDAGEFEAQGRIEAGVPDICSTSANVLARLQTSYSELFSALTKVVIQGVRSLPVRTISFQQGTIGLHVSAMIQLLKVEIMKGFNHKHVVASMTSLEFEPGIMNRSGSSMYLGSLLSHLHSCLFEEKRERRMVNVPLLLGLFEAHSRSSVHGGGDSDNEISFFNAIVFIFKQSLCDFEFRSKNCLDESSVHADSPKQMMSRTTAACLPPATSVLRRLLSGPAITASPASSVLSRVKHGDLALLLGEDELSDRTTDSTAEDDTFSPERFMRTLLCTISETISEAWSDPRLVHAPPYITHPFATLVAELMAGLEDATKKSEATSRASGDDSGLWGPFRGLISTNRANLSSGSVANPPEDFEPSDEAISRLEEMGFSRDHAWDAIYTTRSNVLEIAMEYALSHPPSSPSSIERRRTALADRRRRREQADNTAASSGDIEANPGVEAAEGNEPRESSDVTAASRNEQMEVDQRNETTGTGTSKLSEDATVTNARACLDLWKKEATRIACDVLAGARPRGVEVLISEQPLGSKVDGDGDLEASTVVLCSFLLDLCQRYPSERNRIASELITRVKALFVEQPLDGRILWHIQPGKEASFAALCHGAVLFTRALPKVRTLVLKEDLVHRMLSCLETHWASRGTQQSTSTNDSLEVWPLWYAPSLLLLDVMAQPVVAFSETEAEDGDLPSDVGKPPSNEFRQVKEEHRVQARALSVLADDLFSTLYKERQNSQVFVGEPEAKGQGARDVEITAVVPSSKADDQFGQQPTNDSSLFKSVPAYFALLPSDTSESCVDICIRIVSSPSPPPPGVIHATLLLLMRLLRSPRTSSYCLGNGVAEKLLALPRSCRFTGHTGLVTLIFRRLLEDESSLQIAMETEIRGTITKLLGKKDGGSSGDRDRQSISSRSFVQAITPLLCRDPASFLKAVAVSVRFEKPGAGDGSNTNVTLLTSTERAANVRIVHDILRKRHGPTANHKGLSNRKLHGHRLRRANPSPRSKTPTRSNKRGLTPKRTKREKAEGKDRQDDDSKLSAPSSTPAVQVTSLLINCAIQRSTSLTGQLDAESTKRFDFGFSETFLWAANILEMLADLVLAIPACASAIHKFRPSRNAKDRVRHQRLAHPVHSLLGCPSPPKTFVSFLLHVLLTQDRWSSRKDKQIWDSGSDESGASEESKARRNTLFRRTQVSQSTARLLVALVARPGDVRRRVLSELVFALSGGELGLSVASPASIVERFRLEAREVELHALQAWGELCLGLAAPRSNGSNYDGNSMLSFEVVKIMLECGMAHALLLAVHRVDLHHPLATSTIGSLILPFEILSRPSVAEVIKSLAAKEALAKEAKEASKALKQATVASTGKSEDGEDQMLDEGFVDETRREDNMDDAIDDSFVGRMPGDQNEVSDEANRHDLIVAEEDEDNTDGDDMDIDDDDDSAEVDDEVSSDDESDESSEVEDSEDEDDDEDDDDEHDGEDGESILEDSEENNSTDGFGQDVDLNGDYRADMLADNSEYDGVENGRAGDGGIDEGWTRIESTGFGGMLLGSRRGMGQPVGGFGAGMTSRTRGFIDAAEAMIGTLLRTGEIHGDALAEIEGSLGIRIMSGNRGLTSIDGPNRGDGPFGDGFGSRQVGPETSRAGSLGRRDVVGTFPQIHQRAQPDVGYSALGGGGRWNEISSMEYVYGGPSITAGSRNYDVVSPLAPQDEADLVPTVSQIEGQLFPGGPASATLSRTQHSLHPLLCGVDLPPVNSLVSDLLPHGVRATRRGQMTTRRPGDWTSSSFSGGGLLVSTSNGNIVRSNRAHTGGSLSMTGGGRGVSGPVGWTDEGLPFDATVEEFSAAIEIALEESMAPPGVADEAAERAGAEPSGNQHGIMRESDGAGEAYPADNLADSENVNSSVLEEANAETRASNDEPSPEANDGDRVASSLASGLRLSPQSDENDYNSGPDQEQNAATGGSNMQDNEVNVAGNSSEESKTDDMDTDHGQETPQVPPPSYSGTEERPNPASAREPNFNGLVCPPGIDPEVFNQLPLEMQQEVAEQARAASDLAAQLDAESSLDPEALAALPESMRREVIEQEQQERRRREREQAPADPANAEEMDNASFVASLAPDLRNEILMTADDAFLQSLPPNIIAEAQILRERASANRRGFESALSAANEGPAPGNGGSVAQRSSQNSAARDHGDGGPGSSSRRKPRAGKLRVETDRNAVVYLPPSEPALSPPVAMTDLKALLRFLYLLSPVRPHRLLQKIFQNLCTNSRLRFVLSSTFIKLLQDDNKGALESLEAVRQEYLGSEDWRSRVDIKYDDSLRDFPPPFLIGAAPEVLDTDGLNPSITLLRRKQNSDTAASIAANLPMSAKGSRYEQYLPPVVATRIVDTLQQMCKSSPRFCLDMLLSTVAGNTEMDSRNSTGFEMLIDLLEKPRYSKSSANLEQLLILLEHMVSPLSHLTKHGEEDVEIAQKDVDAAAAVGKEWVDVPRIVVSQDRLQLLCSILRMETCRDTSFTKVNTIARRLCRIEANRGFVLTELASVASALGTDAVRDLKALAIRLAAAVADKDLNGSERGEDGAIPSDSTRALAVSGKASSSVAVSTSTSELKLLRVLQTLQALCTDTSEENTAKKSDGFFVTEELADLLQAMNLDSLWLELTSCLKIVQILEGVNIEEDAEKKAEDAEALDGEDENNSGGKKLQNSVAGLLTRFLPSIEAFFVANASATRRIETDSKHGGKEREKEPNDEKQSFRNLVGGTRLVEFVSANKVLLNALIRNNSGLLDKGLRALIQVPHCRHLLDFDVKRHWFKTQMRRLRQQASRRHGSLRLHIRRRHVFEDAYHQLRLRNAEEMRGRLHITFRNEEGVDAGGLSREFFGILAKEIFDPNYALFTSTEDGSTFQPNPNSSINPDHLSYFRFVGRIVGKAVSDGYLLDAHFTRSLYKHMLGIKPTHHDMEAIDPDYYKNLKTILEFDLGDLGLDLTFSIEDHSFGRNQTLDLIPSGRDVPVTEQNKAQYVSLVCQHRMTTAISSQIKAYLDGFYELVSPDLVAIFAPRELELLISGLPDIDVNDLKQNTDYVGWKATDRQIQWFWEVLFALSRNQKASFLQFVTGSSKVPLAGFGELPGMRGVQKFSIHKASGSNGALMSAHTCFNSLDLPVYGSEEELREKLLYAINEGGGTFLLA